MNWNKVNLRVGICACVLFAILVFFGVKSPFGAIGKALGSGGTSGRGSSGFFYYGGGK